jgi:hypothetical protein
MSELYGHFTIALLTGRLASESNERIAYLRFHVFHFLIRADKWCAGAPQVLRAITPDPATLVYPIFMGCPRLTQALQSFHVLQLPPSTRELLQHHFNVAPMAPTTCSRPILATILLPQVARH